jgi:hypothetical protein
MASRHVSFALVVTVLLAAHATPLPAADAPRAERPVYHVGDKWIRTDGAWELTRIEKDTYIFSAGRDKEFHLTKDLGVTKIVLDGRTELDIDSPPKFTWPLEVGKWGVGRALWRNAPPRPLLGFTGAINVTWQVDLSEDLATAAGSFKTLRISEKIETVAAGFGGSGQQFGQVFLWYAPNAQRFVKAEGNLKGLSWEMTRGAQPAAPPAVASRPPDPSRREAPPSAPAGHRESSPPAASAPAPASPPPSSAPPAPPATNPQVAAVPKSDLQAPKITLSSPAPDARVTEAQVLITGLVTDNIDVVRIQVLVNGVEATPLRDVGVTGKGVPLSAIAPLKPGPNVLEIVATDKAGNVTQMLRTVTRVGGKPAAGSPPAPAPPGR